MATWQILASIIVSLSVSTASDVPLLDISSLKEGISNIPHFILFFKAGNLDLNGRLVEYT